MEQKLICVNNMQLMLLHCPIDAKYMETGKKTKKREKKNKAKEAIVLSTVIATNCTSSYKSYRMFSFTFTEMTVIDYIKTIFISTGTRIWHS